MRHYIIILTFFFTQTLSAQIGEWTWMNGDSIPNQSGVFGTQGISASTNKPPSLYEPIQWTDMQGNFWLFGGAKNFGVNMSDLWKFNPLTNEWTWVKGPGISNQWGVYGTQNISNPANNPGSRGWGALGWVDSTNNLWLWGGSGSDGSGNVGYLTDLWKYNISTNEWTWINGPNAVNQLGVYGTKGIPSTTNIPGSRQETAASWVDDNNNLWLFGGFGRTTTIPQGRLNDLWKYNISTNEWTWVNGTNLIDQVGVYGTQGISNSLNTPGGRWIYCVWKDTVGNFWLFGGAGIDATGSAGLLNDLWKYDVSINEWTWINGSTIKNSSGSYGTKCAPSSLNSPPARQETRVSWVDNSGNFWMFGGQYSTSFYNDLWHYNISSNEWTWVSGDNILNQNSVYGTPTISNPSNKCGARCGAIGWKDSADNLWLFGGAGPSTTFLNDLWRFAIDTTCSMTTTIQELRPTESIQIIPNPFKEHTTIQYYLGKPTQVTIEVYDLQGKKIASLLNENKSAGKFEITFSPDKFRIEEGMYLLFIQFNGQTVCKKIITTN